MEKIEIIGLIETIATIVDIGIWCFMVDRGMGFLLYGLRYSNLSSIYNML